MKKTPALILAFCFSVLSCVCSVSCAQGLKYYVYSDVVFSYSMSFSAEIAGKNAKKAYDEMIELMEEINRQININYGIESDILKFNRASAGQQVKLGDHAYTLIKKAQEIYNDPATQGLFNAAVYPLTYLWGIDALNIGFDEFSAAPPPSFRDGYVVEIKATEKPTAAQIAEIKALCDLNNLVLTDNDDGHYASKTTAGLMVDLGGIAKGYAVGLCRQICEKHQIESAMVDLSGHLMLYGKRNKTDNWPIAVREPIVSLSTEIICGFDCAGDTTVLTSGDYERYRVMYTDATESSLTGVCHILNANTGLPYNIYRDADGNYRNLPDNIASCTIILEDGALADAYATIACVMGIEKAVEFLSGKGIQAILFTQDKRMALTGGITLLEGEGMPEKYKKYENLS